MLVLFKFVRVDVLDVLLIDPFQDELAVDLWTARPAAYLVAALVLKDVILTVLLEQVLLQLLIITIVQEVKIGQLLIKRFYIRLILDFFEWLGADQAVKLLLLD